MVSLRPSIAIYFVIWWLVLFAVLPFGVRSQHEAGRGRAGHRARRAASCRSCCGKLRLDHASSRRSIFAAASIVYVDGLDRRSTISLR